MLSINPQRGSAEKLRLVYAFKGGGCSVGLPLAMLFLPALETFIPCSSGRSDGGITSLLSCSQPLPQDTTSPGWWGHGIKSHGTGEGTELAFPLSSTVSRPIYTTSEGQRGC